MTLLGFAENSIQLVPDGTIFFHIALILVMVFVLNATLFRPINRILAERERRTRGRSSEARDTLRSVEEKMSNYERALREARAEGYRRMEEERAAAMLARQSSLDAVRAEITGSISEQKDSLRAQAEQARAALNRDAQSIAAEISSHILHRPVSNSSLS